LICACCGLPIEGKPAYQEDWRPYCQSCYDNPDLWFAKPEQIAECKRYLKQNPTQFPLEFFKESKQ